MSLAAISSVQPSPVAPVEAKAQPPQTASAATPPAADKVSISPAAQHAASGDGDHDGH